MGVQDDLTGGGQRSRPRSPRCLAAGEVERGLGAGEVAEGSGTAHVQRRIRAEGLQRRGAVGEGPVEVEGVGDVELGLEPHRAREVHLVVVDRRVAGVDMEVAVLRIRGRVGPGEVVALDRLSDEPVQLRGTDPTRDRGDLGVHERRGLRVSEGVVWMVTSATVRARHAGTRPDWTCAHRRGRRWRSSRA